MPRCDGLPQLLPATLFAGITPENAFKWFNFEAQPGNTSQGQALLESRYIAFAQRHRMPMVRGHTLEWLKEEEGERGGGDH
jgi:GH35 family endo-1,4-beta-xylanase